MIAPELSPEQLARCAHQAAAQSQLLVAECERYALDLERRGLHEVSSGLRAAIRTAIAGKAAL